MEDGGILLDFVLSEVPLFKNNLPNLLALITFTIFL